MACLQRANKENIKTKRCNTKSRADTCIDIILERFHLQSPEINKKMRSMRLKLNDSISFVRIKNIVCILKK
jgi:hypothetical protein